MATDELQFLQSPHFTSFSHLDLVVFLMTLLLTFLITRYGVIKQKKIAANTLETSERSHFLELLLMGRRLTLPLFVATLASTWYGGIFAVAQISYESGIYNFFTQGVFWYLTYLFFAFYLLKKLSNLNAFRDSLSMSEMIGSLVGPRAYTLSSFFNITNLLPLAYVIGLSHFLKLFLGLYAIELSDFLAYAGAIVLTLSYSLWGGLKSIVYSDVIQFSLMMTAVLLVAVLSFLTWGLAPLDNLPDHYFHPLGNFHWSESLVWAFLALGTLIDPNFYHRAMAAKNEKVVKWGLVICTIIWMIFDLSLTIGAMYAKAVLPSHIESNLGYFIYALKLLPPGLAGLFLAGILATLMSTLDSYLFLSASVIHYDFFHKSWAHFKIFQKTKTLRFQLSLEQQQKLWQILVAAICLFLVPFFVGNIKLVWKSVGSVLTAAMLVPTVLAIKSPHFRNENNFLFSALISSSTTLVWIILNLEESWGVPGLYPGIALALGLNLFFYLRTSRRR